MDQTHEPTSPVTIDWDKVPADVKAITVTYVNGHYLDLHRPKKIILTLNEAQAEALSTVVNAVGGHPDMTARGRISEIGLMLLAEGIEGNYHPKDGSIYFLAD